MAHANTAVALGPPSAAAAAPRRPRGRLRALAEKGPAGTAARTAVVGAAGFGIGLWAVDDLQFAVFAAFTGIGLTGFADFGGSLRGRASANVVTGLLAMGLVAVGTAASKSAALGPITALVLTFLVVMAGGLGGYARAASRVLIIFLVLAIGIPAPLASLPERIGGLAVGLVLVTVGSVLLWPQRPRREIEVAIADGATAVADAIAAVTSGAPGAEAALARAQTAVTAARARAARMGATPAGPVARDRARAYLLDDLERAVRIVGQVRAGGVPHAPDPAVAAVVRIGRERLADARRTFLALATAMRGGAPAPAGPEGAFLDRTESDLEAAGAEAVDPERIVAASEWALVANELAWTAGIAAIHSTGRTVPLGRGDLEQEGAERDERANALVRRAIAVLRADLTLRSVRFQDGVRTAAALAVAVSLTAALDLSHGFWVSLATLTVLKTAARSTAISAFDAVVGTAVGFGLSVLIVLAADVEHPVYPITLPFLIFLSIWANGAIGLAAGQAAFTATVVVLFNLLEPAGWVLGVARVEDVAIGAAAGILIGVVAWPRGTRAELAPATGALLSSAARYMRVVLTGLLTGEERRSLDSAERLAAVTASQRLDEVLQLSLAEGRPGPERMRYWLAIAGEAHRLWYIVDHSSLAPVDDSPACAPLRERLERAVTEAAGALEAAGRATAESEPPRPASVVDPGEVRSLVHQCLDRSRTPETLATLARLLLIARWVEAASDAPRALGVEVAAATRPDPPELLTPARTG